MNTLLGIETSCDETAAAVVIAGQEVRSNIVASQVALHQKYRGVVPEIASRAHLERLDVVIAESLQQAGVTLDDVDAIAVSHRPGLVGCLIIGLTAAKTLAWAKQKALIAVNHVHAHATSPAIVLDRSPWPAVALVVSGGHTSLYHVQDYDRIRLLGSTTDDACGEAFDKVASILNLGYPGGPAIDRLAQQGNPHALHFPRTLLEPDSLDFSFSGIKTAVLYHVHGSGKISGGLEKMSPSAIADTAASFQQAVTEVLITKTLLAAQKTGVATVVAGGGVVANAQLRRDLSEACREKGFNLHLAPMAYCTDNGAMIAAHGFQLLQKGVRSALDIDAYSQNEPESLSI